MTQTCGAPLDGQHAAAKRCTAGGQGKPAGQSLAARFAGASAHPRPADYGRDVEDCRRPPDGRGTCAANRGKARPAHDIERVMGGHRVRNHKAGLNGRSRRLARWTADRAKVLGKPRQGIQNPRVVCSETLGVLEQQTSAHKGYICCSRFPRSADFRPRRHPRGFADAASWTAPARVVCSVSGVLPGGWPVLAGGQALGVIRGSHWQGAISAAGG
jgi:hypothetical protein